MAIRLYETKAPAAPPCVAVFSDVTPECLAQVAAGQAESERQKQEAERLAAQSQQLSDSSSGPSSPPATVSPSGSGGVEQIIIDAANRYGQSPADALRVANCESTTGRDPSAYDGSSGHLGLFQFLARTWATTPYAASDPLDNYANANAAMWMWANGRRGEWECQ